MAMKIRLARRGSKKRPYYRIVAADSRMPRDGRFIEKLGIYNPLLPKDSEDRVKMDVERIKEWLAKGAQPTDRIARMLEAAGALPKAERSNPKKAVPGKAAQERAASRADKASKAAEAAKAPARAEAVAEEVPAEEVAGLSEAPHRPGRYVLGGEQLDEHHGDRRTRVARAQHAARIHSRGAKRPPHEAPDDPLAHVHSRSAPPADHRQPRRGHQPPPQSVAAL